MHNVDLLVLSAIFVAGFACQWIAWRVKLPSILFLLLTGILAGPVMGWLNPDELLGDLLTPVVSIAVAIILYEGSLTLKLSEIRGHGAVVRNLVTVGVAITWFVATLAAHLILGWDIYLAALFGGIVTVSGPSGRRVRYRAYCAGRASWSTRLVPSWRSSYSTILSCRRPRPG
jgi:CPA1 family monovalent cation:H+ antiporter